MKRTLYDSRSIPLDLLFTLSDMPRGMFGDPAPIVAETHDAPKTPWDVPDPLPFNQAHPR